MDRKKPMKSANEMNVQVSTHCANLSQTELQLCDPVMANNILRNLILLLQMHLFLAKPRNQNMKQETRANQISTTMTLTTQSADTQPSTKSTGSAPTSEKKRDCVFFNKTDHNVSKCSGFTKASLSDRTNFVKEKHLC